MQNDKRVTDPFQRVIFEGLVALLVFIFICLKRREGMESAKLQDGQRSVGHKNNFNMLRMMAALCVMRGHMGLIADIDIPSVAGMELHTFGVSVLFIISGYLNAKSWNSDPHYGRFLLKRLTRLWPAYAIFIILAVFIAGPLLSELGPLQYFRSNYGFYLNNLRFYIVYWLPGVFGDGMPYPNVINGSLWTMPVELAICLICPIVLSRCARMRSRSSGAIAVAGIAALLEAMKGILYPGEQWVVYGTDWLAAWYLITYFLIGMAFASLDIRKYLNLQVSTLLLLLLSGAYFHKSINALLSMVILPYFVLSVALIDKPVFERFGTKYELSYGVYLYGFFFQQFTVWLFNVKLKFSLGGSALMLISLVLTLVAAWLSYTLVEKPVFKLTRRLLNRFKTA